MNKIKKLIEVEIVNPQLLRYFNAHSIKDALRQMMSAPNLAKVTIQNEQGVELTFTTIKKEV